MVNEKIELMQKKVANSLERSGEFQTIELGYKLGDALLDRQHGNHLYAKKKKEFLDLHSGEVPEYLLIFHSDKPSCNSLVDTIKSISNCEYHVGNVLWKGEPFFKWARAPFRPAIKEYELEEERAMIDLSLTERVLEILTKNNLIYFKPSTQRLQIIKFEGNIRSDYAHKGEGFFEQKRNLVRTRKNEVYQDFDLNIDKLTLIGYANRKVRLALPVRAPGFVSRGLWQLALEIKKRNKKEVERLVERLSIQLSETSSEDPNVRYLQSLIEKSKGYKLI